MVTTTPPTPPTAGRNGVPGGPARSNFSFVRYVWPTAYEECLKVERFVDADPVISCFYARKVLERVVSHIWALRKLGDTQYRSLAEMTRDRAFTKCVDNETMLRKMTLLRKSGNDAAHADDMEGKQAPTSPQRARNAAAHLYDLMAWAVRHHSANPQAAPGWQHRRLRHWRSARPRRADSSLTLCSKQQGLVMIQSLESSSYTVCPIPPALATQIMPCGMMTAHRWPSSRRRSPWNP